MDEKENLDTSEISEADLPIHIKVAQEMIDQYPLQSFGYRFMSQVLRRAERPHEAIRFAIKAVQVGGDNPINDEEFFEAKVQQMLAEISGNGRIR